MILTYIECVLLKGYLCEQFNNPADFFIDAISGDLTISTMSG